MGLLGRSEKIWAPKLRVSLKHFFPKNSCFPIFTRILYSRGLKRSPGWWNWVKLLSLKLGHFFRVGSVASMSENWPMDSTCTYQCTVSKYCWPVSDEQRMNSENTLPHPNRHIQPPKRKQSWRHAFFCLLNVRAYWRRWQLGVPSMQTKNDKEFREKAKKRTNKTILAPIKILHVKIITCHRTLEKALLCMKSELG